LPDRSYRTAYFGKWHLGDEVFAQQGFEEWVSIEDTYLEYYSENRNRQVRSDYSRFLDRKGYNPDDTLNHRYTRKFVTKLPYRDSKTSFLAGKACAFLSECSGTPFILYLSFLEPHTPFHGPFDGYYNADSLPLPGPVGDGNEGVVPYRVSVLQEKYGRTVEEWKSLHARYAGLVKQVDVSVGRVLDTLEALGLDKNTIVVFTSDHGEMMGAHNLMYKTVMYEEAVRVPLLISYPPLFGEEQRMIEENTSHIHLVPTLLDILGAEPSGVEELQGRSLLPALSGAEKLSGDVFIEWNPDLLKPVGSQYPVKKLGMNDRQVDMVSGQSVRTVVTQDRWKLSLNDRDSCQLFDLNGDPWEQNNLYYLPESRERVLEMADRIREWQVRTGDTLDLSVVL
jgi:arylsulfatase A-like enzyme